MFQWTQRLHPSREGNASFNNKCTSSSHKISSSGVFLVAGLTLDHCDRHWRRSPSRCFTARATTVSEDRYQRISVFVRTKGWCGWGSLFEAGATGRDFFIQIALSLECSVRPVRFQRSAIGRLKPILLRSQNCFHFGDFRPSHVIIRNPVNLRG